MTYFIHHEAMKILKDNRTSNWLTILAMLPLALVCRLSKHATAKANEYTWKRHVDIHEEAVQEFVN